MLKKLLLVAAVTLTATHAQAVTGWSQGSQSEFAAQSGANTSYISANYNNTGTASGIGTISNWLMTPVVSFASASTLTFWTRTVAVPAFADRLEVRLSTAGASSDVGATSSSVGMFTTSLLTINPTLTVTGYPSVWTQYTVNLGALGAGSSGRIAFRYYVTNAGPNGANSDYIGIDSFSLGALTEGFDVVSSLTGSGWVMTNNSDVTPVPEAGTAGMLGAGLLGLVALGRRRRGA